MEFARADLFGGAVCVTTPIKRTNAEAMEAVEDFWKSLGMTTVRLSPRDHDRLLADVSHLPHAVAAALVTMQADEGLDLAGKGFLDATRIAGGDGGLSHNILLDNRDNVRRSLRGLRNTSGLVAELLDGGRGEELRSLAGSSGRAGGKSC